MQFFSNLLLTNYSRAVSNSNCIVFKIHFLSLPSPSVSLSATILISSTTIMQNASAVCRLNIDVVRRRQLSKVKWFSMPSRKPKQKVFSLSLWTENLCFCLSKIVSSQKRLEANPEAFLSRENLGDCKEQFCVYDLYRLHAWFWMLLTSFVCQGSASGCVDCRCNKWWWRSNFKRNIISRLQKMAF